MPNNMCKELITETVDDPKAVELMNEAKNMLKSKYCDLVNLCRKNPECSAHVDSNDGVHVNATYRPEMEALDFNMRIGDIAITGFLKDDEL